MAKGGKARGAEQADADGNEAGAGLTDKQRRFVLEYLVDLCATRAAMRAGYSRKNADKIGPELLGKTRVAAAIRAAQERRSKRTEITADSVLTELAKIGFANMADYLRPNADGDPTLDFSDLTRDQTAALVEVTVDDFKDGRGENARDVRRVKFKLADKRAALVDVGKHLGMFVERREVGEPGDFANLSDAELKAEVIASAKALGLGAGRKPEETHH